MEDYFAFFDLDYSLEIDLSNLRRRFVENSRIFHPDFHTLADEGQRDEMLEKSTLNNKAYKILRDRETRIKHLLDLKDLLSEKDSVPSMFLMEMMDINEQLMEVQMDPESDESEKVVQAILDIKNQLDAEYTSLSESDLSESTLSDVKDWYYKNKYVNRLQERLVGIINM